MPWNRCTGDQEADGEIPEDKAVEAEVVMPSVPETVFIYTRDKEPREFHITKADAEKHGYTRGCGEC